MAKKTENASKLNNRQDQLRSIEPARYEELPPDLLIQQPGVESQPTTLPALEESLMSSYQSQEVQDPFNSPEIQEQDLLLEEQETRESVPLPKEWNPDPDQNPLIRLFNNPYVTPDDLLNSGAFKQDYSPEVDPNKLRILETLKPVNGILIPYYWKGKPEEFASKFNDEYQNIARSFNPNDNPHDRPLLTLEILLCMSAEVLYYQENTATPSDVSSNWTRGD